MDYIFVSYSSEDRGFAQKLIDSLGAYYDIWIDQEDIAPGSRWEKRIVEAITGCKVFLVIVSPTSNESDWVERETLLAEKEKKYRIPVLIDGELPFRLLNVQFVDFRGEYEGGLRDLLDILKVHLSPGDQSVAAARQLLGEGMEAYLQHDPIRANNLIGQALAISPALIDWTVERFWATLRRPVASSTADALADSIMILEQAALLEQDQRYGEQPAYRWSLELDLPAEALAKVDHVEYMLHPTFADPHRTIRDRASRFKLESIGWGVFWLKVLIHFEDGSVLEGKYKLTLAPGRSKLVTEG